MRRTIELRFREDLTKEGNRDVMARIGSMHKALYENIISISFTPIPVHDRRRYHIDILSNEPVDLGEFIRDLEPVCPAYEYIKILPKAQILPAGDFRKITGAPGN